MPVQRIRTRLHEVQEKIAKTGPNEGYNRGQIYVSAAVGAVGDFRAHSDGDRAFAAEMLRRAAGAFRDAGSYHSIKASKAEERIIRHNTGVFIPTDTRASNYAKNEAKFRIKSERDRIKAGSCRRAANILDRISELGTGTEASLMHDLNASIHHSESALYWELRGLSVD